MEVKERSSHCIAGTGKGKIVYVLVGIGAEARTFGDELTRGRACRWDQEKCTKQPRETTTHMDNKNWVW